jgi:hypothetical protein
MTRNEMLLLTELNRLCGEAAGFALGFPENTLPLSDEYAFGFRLLDVGYGILLHARERQQQEQEDEDADGLSDLTAGLKWQLQAQNEGGMVIELNEAPCPEG